jgi:hypothetical protein
VEANLPRFGPPRQKPGSIVATPALRPVLQFASARFQFLDQLADHLEQIGISDATGGLAPALSVGTMSMPVFTGHSPPIGLRHRRGRSFSIASWTLMNRSLRVLGFRPSWRARMSSHSRVAGPFPARPLMPCLGDPTPPRPFSMSKPGGARVQAE